MAARKIAYYFTLVSPWAYLGHELFLDIAVRHQCQVDFHPVALGQVFPETGGLQLAQRHPARQFYRFSELQRWREKRGVELTLRPKFFPCDISLADRLILALLAEGAPVATFILAGFHAVWRDDRNAADRETLTALLRETGQDPALLEKADSEAIRARYAELTANAIAAHVFGSPTYALNGELFWGQDRLELLEEALASGRRPYLP